MGASFTTTEVPAEMQDQYEEMRAEMIEAVAEEDETLLDKYMADEDLTPRRTCAKECARLPMP